MKKFKKLLLTICLGFMANKATLGTTPIDPHTKKFTTHIKTSCDVEKKNYKSLFVQAIYSGKMTDPHNKKLTRAAMEPCCAYNKRPFIKTMVREQKLEGFLVAVYIRNRPQNYYLLWPIFIKKPEFIDGNNVDHISLHLKKDNILEINYTQINLSGKNKTKRVVLQHKLCNKETKWTRFDGGAPIVNLGMCVYDLLKHLNLIDNEGPINNIWRITCVKQADHFWYWNWLMLSDGSMSILYDGSMSILCSMRGQDFSYCTL